VPAVAELTPDTVSNAVRMGGAEIKF
jgi:hypothetical protein